MSAAPDTTPNAAPWLLLRGLTRESGHWGAFTARFSEAFPDAPVVALDLPGNGMLHRERSPWSVAAMAEHCRAQAIRLRDQGIEPPYRLLAMSLGAMAAAAWAANEPDEIDALVLINSSMRPVSPFHHRLRPRHYGALLRLLLTGADAQAWEETIWRITSNRPLNAVDAQATLREWVSLRQQRPVSVANSLRQLIAAARFSAPRAMGRTLVLTSAADSLVDHRCSLALAQRWHAPIAVHTWAGHDLPLDDGGWVIDQIKQWLQCGAGATASS